MLNALYIEQVQSFPDTTITLTNSKKLVVKETEKEIFFLVTRFYQMIGLQGSKIETGDKE